MGKFIDISGQKFGRLTAIRRSEERGPSQGHIKWECRCDCGEMAVVLAYGLRNGNTKSCGCLNRELRASRFKTHGESNTRLYYRWAGMIARCHNPNHGTYQHYGGKGVTVCNRWRNDFTAFLEDVGKPPGPGYSLERVNRDCGYEPGNVVWADRKSQSRNTSRTHFLEHNGITKCVTDWADEVGIMRSTLSGRLRRGWSVHDALTIPTVR